MLSEVKFAFASIIKGLVEFKAPESIANRQEPVNIYLLQKIA